MLSLLLSTLVLGPAPEPAPAETQPETPGEPAELSAVEDIAFALVGEWPGLEPAQLEPVLASNLVDLGIEIEVTTRPAGNVFVQLDWARTLGAQRRGRAVFWLVRRDPETVQLFVLPPGTDLGYVRDIAFAGGPDELAELLAVIVRGAAESLQAGPPSGMRGVEPQPDPDPPPDPDPDPDPPVLPPVDPGPWVHVSVSYLGASLSSNAPWQHGAAVDVGLRLRSRLDVGLTAGWGTGLARDALSPLQLHRVPIGLTLGYAFDPDRRVSGRILATGVVEAVSWQPTDASDLELAGGTDLRVGLGVRGDLVIKLHAGLGLLLGGSVVGWLRNVRVDVDESGELRTVLGPAPVGGELRAGLEYAF
ncbi:hypothetical protein PPSIR1_18557 [Plesiocystis pacifica SIR-1]|uniref:Uncharacterized protein n=1 Tax=Plesiocystis pacifica SIR-1 TaxID=391625 RepID=A6GCS0_9BACT|nr:hypothetical protein [Plesiocystis pacifica]EDM76336.1 hypothetical protein PPSIR1_18557 [Plesiocystis pacifica SIR-1]